MLILLIVPVLIKDGMFMDGQQFSCVAMNLAKGIGTFWFPYYSPTWYSSDSVFFLEQPPFFYLLQSFFFKIIGYGMYTERIYSFLAAIANAFIISLIWRLIFHSDDQIKKMSWLPVLFWIIIPVCFWSFQNNMLENTMGIFTSLAVYFMLKGLIGNKKNILFFTIISGVFIFLASFSKGIPGLFPITVPLICWLVFRNGSFIKFLLLSILLIAIPVIIYSLLVINDNAYESLRFYFFERALNRIGDTSTAESHFYILARLFSELIPDIILCAIIFFINKSCSLAGKNFFKNRNSLLFLLIGAAGSMPLMLTMVQKGFYLLPSLAFFAISFAIVASTGVNQFIKFINEKKRVCRILFVFSLALFIFSVSYSALQVGKASRDSSLLKDVYAIGEIVPRNSLIDINKDMYEKWNLQLYLYRYFLISVDPASRNHEYYLTEKRSTPPDSVAYNKIAISTECYDLFKLKKNPIR